MNGVQSARRYNSCIDFIKGIACILVVLIHCKFPGRFGLSVQAVARFAVPFFFMVSGFYCYRETYVDNNVIKNKILHIAKITVFWYLFYLLFFIFENWLIDANHTFVFSIPHIIKVAFFNQPSNVPPHFWFLFALINVYGLYFLVNRFKIRKAAYLFSFIMFIVLIGMQQGASLLGYTIKPYYFRNFLIEGFPFFMLGHYLHENEGNWKISNGVLLTIITLSAMVSVIESFMFKSYIKVFLSTYSLVVCLFIYAIKNQEKHQGIIQLIGKQLSLYVYILHWFVRIVVDNAIVYYDLKDISLIQWIRPLVIIGITILLSILCDKFSSMIFKKEQMNVQS